MRCSRCSKKIKENNKNNLFNLCESCTKEFGSILVDTISNFINSPVQTPQSPEEPATKDNTDIRAEFVSRYEVYCDGACKGNPGVGGFGVVIYHNGMPIRTFKGASKNTTNNRMELQAVITALRYSSNVMGIPAHSPITIYSDSQYVVNTINCGWQRNKNQDLWELFDHVKNKFINLKFVWVKGHNNIEGNENADQLANLAIQQLQEGTIPMCEVYKG